MPLDQKITEESVKKFKRDVVGSCPSLVTLQDQYIARSIPLGVFEKVLVSVFNGDNQLARDVMYNRFDRIKDSDAEQDVERISTLLPASIKIANAIKEANPILLISDIDNDGSLAQALGMELMRISNHRIDVMPRDYDPGHHGYSINQIQDWLSNQGHSGDDNFTVIVSDLGTNQRDTQNQFIETFPNAQLIVADHHKPDIELMMKNDNERTLLVSPFVKGSMRLALKGGGGASGGFLTYKMFKHAIIFLKESNHLEMTELELENRLEPMKMMGKAANLLDRVECDIRLMPLHEKEVSKALAVSSLTGKGRSLAKWTVEEQVDNINSLSSLIGDEGVEALLETRERLVEQNHFAWALFEVIPKITGNVEDEEAPEKVHVPSEVAKLMLEKTPKETATVNYAELLRPYIFNLKYENQFEGSVKKSWLSLAEKVMRELGSIERDILSQIRNFQLVREASDDFVTITQAASHNVSKVFTNKQLNTAYQSLSKAVNMSVSRASVGQLVLSYRTEVPIRELLTSAQAELGNLSFVVRGHDNVGGLTVHMPSNAEPEKVIKELVASFNKAAKHAIDNKPLAESLEVKHIHLSIIKEMLQKMRVDIVPSAEPNIIMRLAPNMTFEDSKTLEKLPVSKIVEKREWETTTESLDFAMTSSLILPNQALKAVANDNFEGALKISLMANGSYIATKALTGAQLRQMEIAVMKMPKEKEQEEIKKLYTKQFKDKELPLIPLSRKEGMEAIEFVADGGKVYRNTEAMVLSMLRQTGHDSYVVLDVEADGGGNAECFELGLDITRPIPGSGHVISQADFDKLVSENEEKIDNFRMLDDGSVMVNERLEEFLASIVISKDGSRPIRISYKSQNLTNIDQDFLDEVGCSSEEAEQKLLSCLAFAGKFIIQAHNLPYDKNIIKVNFPRVYEVIQKATHLDTAPVARRNRIAYTNIQANTVGGVEFFNAEHPGYNLTTLFATKDSFDYPAIKGDHVLQVRGDVVQMLDLKTRITTKMKESRESIESGLLNNLAPLKTPKYGIQKLLLMAMIHDMISHQPVKQIVKVDYEPHGFPALTNELWEHFQENYAYDMTPAQNVAKFSVLPEVQEALDSQLSFESPSDIEPSLLEARNLGTGNDFDPEKKLRTKADKAAHAEKVATVSFADVLKANALNFVRANPENAERFARSWVYELILNHHEPTRKDMPKSFISGVEEMIGVDKDIIELSYHEIYIYKAFRNIQSMLVHEAHNNIGPKGDTYQEKHTAAHMLTVNLKNPFMTGKFAKKHGVSPVRNSTDAMIKQAAESTLKQITWDALDQILNDDVLNNYSAKQLDRFSVDGVSAGVGRSGIAKMRCKTLSDNSTEVHIELPDFDAATWRKMPSEDRFELEEQLEKAVTILVLSNSQNEKLAGKERGALLREISTSEDALNVLKEMKEYFGRMEPTRRETQIKSFMNGGVEAILGNEPLKFPINKELTVADLEVVKESLEIGIKRLKDEQNFESFIPAEELNEAFERAKAQYLGFSILKNEGEKVSEVDGYEPFDSSTKRELTNQKKKLDNLSQVHLDICPDLVQGVLTTKKDPIDFLLKSPMVSDLIKMSGELSMSVDLELENTLDVDKVEVSRPRNK